MVTLFAIPKPFVGHTAVIQHNAIESWKRFHPGYQIILFGNEEGIAEAACEHGVEHIPDVRRNELGTPLMNAVFEEADKIARFEILCYVNSDIMLLEDLNAAVDRVKHSKKFLMVGQRWNLDVVERIDFTQPEADHAIRMRTMTDGALALMWAMDYFVFPRNMWEKLPQFAIGRPGWDNWMLYQARAMNLELINSSLVIMAVHQNHPPA
ncbi:MAG TPA: glycosyl transferase family 2, partial [Bacteroidota bacterium]|nr:glycosyl transferase family 2 [Bacteroidota bacterium]